MGDVSHATLLGRRAVVGGLTLLAPLAAPANAQAPAARVDPRFINHPYASVALNHFQARRWAELSALVRGLRPDSACVLLDDLGDLASVDADVAGLTESPSGHAIAGSLYVNWAWVYRGMGAGTTVTGDRLRDFVDRLALARESLERAIDVDANDGVAYNFLIRTMKGQSAVQGLQSIWEAFEGIEHTRKPIRAYSSMADVLSAKWFGSEEAMLGFARLNQRALEPASHALICQVANETLIARLRRQGLEGAANFAGQQGVLGEVGAANDAYLALSAPEDFQQANYANGQFSFFFSFLGLNDYARPYLQSMGAALSGPWTLFDAQAFDMLEHARAAAGLGST